jgi:two-component system sensor histidine kinase BaeS
MGTRAPALILVASLAVLGASSAATAFLVDEQLATTSAANAEKLDTITAELFRHGLVSGGWTGSEEVVRRLSYVTGKRIRLTTASAGAVDSDLLTGRNARPVGDPAATIDPRPRLTVSTVPQNEALAVTMLETRRFRQDATLATCLTRAGIPVDVTPGPHGVPRLTADPSALRSAVARVTAQCPTAGLTAGNFVADNTAILGCPHRDDTPPAELAGCLSSAFTARTASVAAEPAVLFVGTRLDGVSVTFAPPLVISVALQAAALVAAILATRLVRRRTAAVTGTGSEQGSSREQAAERSLAHLEDALRRQQEEQREAVAHVAHELRAPLTNLRAYLEGLSAGVVAPEPDLFASLHQETLLQQRIIDDLNEGSACERALTYEPMDLDLAALVQASRLAYTAVAEAAGLRLTVVTGRPLPITGDPARLRQVLANLMSNAVRYTTPGGTVEVRAWPARHLACLQVRDTGMGISAEDLPRVFDRYWRSDAAAGRVPGGTGLGLPISREMIVAHGGRIDIDSRPGVGTTVTVVLPMRPADPSQGPVRTRRTGHLGVRRHRSSR